MGNTVIERKIYHYLGNADSLGFDMQDNFHRLYWEYFAKTPYFNYETLCKLFNMFRTIYTNKQKFLMEISVMMSGKTRNFFTDFDVENIKKIFGVKENEEILTFPENRSIDNLINAMKESRGTKVFFIMMSRGKTYNQINDILKKNDFVEGQDYINAVKFLSENNGVKLDVWYFIKNL